jgi:hypothetical protein
MSIVTVQIGQCGNQIGERLFETLISDCDDCTTLYSNSTTRTHYTSSHAKRLNEAYIRECTSRFFSEQETSGGGDEQSTLYARSILIDMESKVVNKLLYNHGGGSGGGSSTRRFKFRDKNSYTQKKGSGNNWY